MADFVYLVTGVLFFVLMGVYAVACDRMWGAEQMVEPIIGLIVGIGLGVYLLYTLIHPE
jgi:K+-transporting ATPase KdpF subunit